MSKGASLFQLGLNTPNLSVNLGVTNHHTYQVM
jgi:hypothetical protein